MRRTVDLAQAHEPDPPIVAAVRSVGPTLFDPAALLTGESRPQAERHLQSRLMCVAEELEPADE